MLVQLPKKFQHFIHEPTRFGHREWLVGWLQGRLKVARKFVVEEIKAGASTDEEVAQLYEFPLAEVQVLREKPDISWDFSGQAADRLEQWAERVWREGERYLLKKTLDDRFGCLPEWVTGRLDAAENFQILQWLYDVDFYETLEELIEDEEQRAKNCKTFTEQWTDSGIRQGLKLALCRQISLKFGEIPAWVDERLKQASDEQLDTWVARILTANTLDEVFNR
ncbi:hypothetical protein [Halomonas sp.]|uniref:hypothetical protein n=1 Tax=Halomonas sp. TaxID=1486246 RepID=UPI003850E2FD